jgi:hypothetical protein
MLLLLLNITRDQIPRYRDCYWDGSQIVIYTRTGGGNRDFYENERSCRENYPSYFTGDDTIQGPWNEDLRKLPGYIKDEDDSFDSTYASFYFQAPEEFKQLTEGLVAAQSPQEKFQEIIKVMQSPNAMEDPRVQRLKQFLEPVFKKITEKL